MHSTTPKTSPEKVKVCDIGTLGAEKEGPEMIQVHGEKTDTRLEISRFLHKDLFLFMISFSLVPYLNLLKNHIAQRILAP